MYPPFPPVSIYALALLGAATLAGAAQSYGGKTVEPARAAKLRDLQGKAQQAAERLIDYRVRLRRREVVGERHGVEDRLMLTIRGKPFSVHIKCLPGSGNEGREMLFVSTTADPTMSVLTGKADVLPGLRMDVGIRSEMVTANSRRTINEAGFAYSSRQFGLAVDRYLSGQPDSGDFEPIGLQTRSESRVPMEVVIQNIPRNQEPLLPLGGKRYWHFNTDPDACDRHLPTLLVTFDDRGREVEYYFYDRLLPHILLENQDFDVDVLWSHR
jgi:hypothetical protein